MKRFREITGASTLGQAEVPSVAPAEEVVAVAAASAGVRRSSTPGWTCKRQTDRPPRGSATRREGACRWLQVEWAYYLKCPYRARRKAYWATVQGSKGGPSYVPVYSPRQRPHQGRRCRLPSSRTRRRVRLLDIVVPALLATASHLGCQDWRLDEQRRWAWYSPHRPAQLVAQYLKCLLHPAAGTRSRARTYGGLGPNPGEGCVPLPRVARP